MPARRSIVVLFLVILYLAALYPTAVAKPSIPGKGVISGMYTVSGYDNITLPSALHVRSYTIIEFRDIKEVRIASDFYVEQGSTLILRFINVSSIALYGNIVYGNSWMSTLIIEAEKCGTIHITSMKIVEANLIANLAGCREARINSLEDYSGTAGLTISNTAIAYLNRVQAGKITAYNVGHLIADRIISYSIEASSPGYVELENTAAYSHINISGHILKPLITARNVATENLVVSGAGEILGSNISAATLQAGSGQLVIESSNIGSAILTGSRISLISTGFSYLRVSGAENLTLYNVSVRNMSGSTPIEIQGPLDKINIISSSIISKASSIYIDATGNNTTITIIRTKIITNNTALTVVTRNLTLQTAVTTIKATTILTASTETPVQVLIVRSNLTQNLQETATVGGLTLPMFMVPAGNITIVGSRIFLSSVYMVSLTTAQGKANLTLARNYIDAVPSIASSISYLLLSRVNLSLCYNESLNCTCGNEYSYAFMAGLEHPVLYGIVDTYNATRGFPANCSIAPIIIYSIIDYTSGNTSWTGTYGVYIAITPCWANITAKLALKSVKVVEVLTGAENTVGTSVLNLSERMKLYGEDGLYYIPFFMSGPITTQNTLILKVNAYSKSRVITSNATLGIPVRVPVISVSAGKRINLTLEGLYSSRVFTYDYVTIDPLLNENATCHLLLTPTLLVAPLYGCGGTPFSLSLRTSTAQWVGSVVNIYGYNDIISIIITLVPTSGKTLSPPENQANDTSNILILGISVAIAVTGTIMWRVRQG